MPETVQCPYCNAFEGLPDSVAHHAQGKSDEQHRGITAAEAKQSIGNGADEGADESGGGQAGNQAGSALHNPPAQESPESEDGGSEGNDAECPYCEHDLEQLASMLEPGDQCHCPRCGSILEWEGEN